MLKPIPVLGALVVAAALVAPTVGRAADPSSVHVSYADLNLASGVGRQKLQGRIAFAARIVCQFEDSRQLDLATATKICRDDAIERARPAYEAAVAAAQHPSVTVGAAASLVVNAS
jgi:UrcA family protein